MQSLRHMDLVHKAKTKRNATSLSMEELQHKPWDLHTYVGTSGRATTTTTTTTTTQSDESDATSKFPWCCLALLYCEVEKRL